MFKKGLLLFLCFFLICGNGFGEPKKYSELIADPAFSKKTPEEQLELMNKKLDSKEWKYEELERCVVLRVFFELFKGEKDYGKKIEMYGNTKQKFSALPQMIEIDLYLMTCYFASTPEGQKGDFYGMLKVMGKLIEETKIYWHAVANLQEGFLAIYLASNPEFHKMDHKGKLGFLNKLALDGIVKDLTTSKFALPVAMDWLLNTPAEKGKPY